MKDKIIYWLEQIHAALSVIGKGVDGKHNITVTDIKAFSGDQLEALEAGDKVIKSDSTGKHAYTVSFKGAGGLCLTYADCENVETVAYEKNEGVWSWDSTDVTHIAS